MKGHTTNSKCVKVQAQHSGSKWRPMFQYMIHIKGFFRFILIKDGVCLHTYHVNKIWFLCKLKPKPDFNISSQNLIIKILSILC